MQITEGSTGSQKALSWLGTAGAMAIMLWLARRDSGYFFTEFTTAAMAATALLGVIVVAVWDRLRIPAASAYPALALSLICLWTGLSFVWSLAPNFTLQELTRTILYLACFLAVLTGRSRRKDVTWAVAAFVVICTGLAAFALLAKIIPDYSQDYTYFSGRLLGSLGYWNGLAAMMVLGVIPCLWFSSGSGVNRWLRPAASAALLLMGVTLFFTLSRGGIFIGVASLLMFLALAPGRLAVMYSLAASFVPGGILVWYTYTSLPSLHAAEEGARIEAGEGRTFALILLAALMASVVLRAAAMWLPSSMPSGRNSTIAMLAFWGLVATGAGIVILSQLDRLEEWRSRGAVEAWQYDQDTIDARGVERLASTSDNRFEFWRIGWNSFSEHPLLGTGGGTYRYVNMQNQSGKAFAKDPHSIWIRFLSDQGVIGFALLLAFLGSLAYAFIRQIRRNRRLARDGLYLALLVAGLGWLADSSLEFNWAMPVVTVAFMILAALALRLGDAPFEGAASMVSRTAGGDAGDSLTIPQWMRMGIMVVAMALSVIFTAQLAADIYAERAWDALLDGDMDQAYADAGRAHKLNYFAVDPLFIRADVKRNRGDYLASRDFLISAIDRAPRESWLYHELALLEFYEMGLSSEGLADLEQAIDLDPQDYDLHLALHVMTKDLEIFSQTGEMPPRPVAKTEEF